MSSVGIPVGALVTYYGSRSTVTVNGKEAAQRFIRHLKEWDSTTGPLVFTMGTESYRVENTADAHGLVRIILRSRLSWIATHFGVTRFAEVALVPIPASKVTNVDRAPRWPARRIAETVASCGVGTVHPLLRFRRAQKATTSASGGDRGDFFSRVAELECVALKCPDVPLILVDDVVTWGVTAAACAAAIWERYQRRVTGLLAIGATNGGIVANAFARRERLIVYDPYSGDVAIDGKRR